jgi:Beta propeller domain
VFTTVRFFDHVAYAVTFERVDPFYVIDFQNPESPTIMGELEVLGFSEYLHPMNSDGSVLAAIGQQADENGQILGMQISVFDAQRDPSNPELTARLNITEDSANSWTYSAASWEPRAVRYLRISDLSGFLIIPVTTYTNPSGELAEGEVQTESEYFEGFVMFSIDLSLPEQSRIQRVLEIDHTDSVTFADGFYYCSWLAERSFVISGHLITMKAHSMVSTDLVSSQESWSLDVDATGGCNNTWYRK